MYKNNIAHSDTIQSCKQKGSLDSDIQNNSITFNKEHITNIIENSRIKNIFCTSKQSYDNLKKCFGGKAKMEEYFDNKKIKCFTLFHPSPTALAYKQFNSEERLQNWQTIIKKQRQREK